MPGPAPSVSRAGSHPSSAQSCDGAAGLSPSPAPRPAMLWAPRFHGVPAGCQGQQTAPHLEGDMQETPLITHAGLPTGYLTCQGDQVMSLGLPHDTRRLAPCQHVIGLSEAQCPVC